MTSQTFPKCSFGEKCAEFAVSFSSFCWEHSNPKEFLASLSAELKNRHVEKPLVLNLKKVVCENLDFSKINFSGSILSQAHFSDCHFVGTHLSNSNMIGARFDGCDLVGSDLRNAHLTRAIFNHCLLSHSDLRGAYLVEAHFNETDFMASLLSGTVLWNADFRGVKNLRKKNFENPDAKGLAALSEKHALVAFESYRTIKHYFYDQGFYEDASWAAYRGLTMERKHFFETRDPRYFPSLLMDILSGYTEKPHRVILSSLTVVLLFGVLYFLLNVPQASANLNSYSRISFLDSIYFSFITVTTVGFGDLVPRPGALFQLLTCAEAFSGPFMAGLYIFTLTRRYAAH